MFDAEYFCNPYVFTLLFNKRHLLCHVDNLSVSLDKMRIINRKKINLLIVTRVDALKKTNKNKTFRNVIQSITMLHSVIKHTCKSSH